MKYCVVGIRTGVKIEDRQKGQTIEGTSLYVTSENPSVDGLVTDKFFINARSSVYPMSLALRPGNYIDVFFNRYGKVDSFSILED